MVEVKMSAVAKAASYQEPAKVWEPPDVVGNRIYTETLQKDAHVVTFHNDR